MYSERFMERLKELELYRDQKLLTAHEVLTLQLMAMFEEEHQTSYDILKKEFIDRNWLKNGK